MAKTNEDLIRAMAGASGDMMDPIPLKGANGEVLDAEKYWVQTRFPSGADIDELYAVSMNEIINRKLEYDGDDVENSSVSEIRHTEGRRGPVLMKAIALNLIADARLPDMKEDGSLSVYEWQKKPSLDAEWVLKRKPPLFYALIRIVSDDVMGTILDDAVGEEEEDVVSEGEDSSGLSGES